jgi:hypothetical protein
MADRKLVRIATVTAAAFIVAVFLATPAAAQVGPGPYELDEATASRFAELALACVHQEYPNKIAHVLGGDDDVQPPRQLSPAFYGCYDWHSSVHGHWLLARLARLFPEAAFASDARAALAQSLTAEQIAEEVRYLEGAGRVSFERPYGLAWLLQLAAELRQWAEVGEDGPYAAQAEGWVAALTPLENLSAQRFRDWLPKLTHPIRTGEHSQTAFAFGLLRDWAGTVGDEAMLALLDERIRTYYRGDRDCPLAYEPGGQDFLSPCLAEADLMRRVMDRSEFAAWLGAFLPDLPLDEAAANDWLPVAVVTDPSDPKLAHLDGLNLARAWMLDGIISGLPEGDPRLPALRAAARAHAESGLEAVTGEHYEGGHWLGSFATYLVTGRGVE